MLLAFVFTPIIISASESKTNPLSPREKARKKKTLVSPKVKTQNKVFSGAKGEANWDLKVTGSSVNQALKTLEADADYSDSE